MYGSLTFDEAYVKRARALVVELGLEDNVELRGLGKPTDVLSRGWCYLQVTHCLQNSAPHIKDFSASSSLPHT